MHLSVFCFIHVLSFYASLKYPATFHSLVSTYVGLCGCRERLGFQKLYLGGGGGGGGGGSKVERAGGGGGRGVG